MRKYFLLPLYILFSFILFACEPGTGNNQTSNNLNNSNNVNNTNNINNTNNVNNTNSEICNDNIDNDGDGFIDCMDLDCLNDDNCSTNNNNTNDAGEDNSDSNPWEFDADAGDACPPEMMENCDNPTPSGCTGTEIADNGLDDNCNGQIDENSTACTPGDVRACFMGPPGRRNVGACHDGQQICMNNGTEFGAWGPCDGGISPSVETCDGLDNDCNGCVDDGLCCDPPIMCPASDDPTLQGAQPFTDFVLDGGNYYTGTAVRWEWTISNGPCDDVLGVRSFTVNGDDSSSFVADTQAITLNFNLSGEYTITMRVYYNDTEYYECIFILHVAGPGLRVENCWDTAGSTDIDLHLMMENNGTNWCSSEDCHYMGCKASNWSMDSWNAADGNINLCIGTSTGSTWQNNYGVCKNPRLDVDNISTVGIPENINVDYPADGQVYRIADHYYSGNVDTHPVINIYCDGIRVATYGYPVSNQVTISNSGGYGCDGDLWRVADVLTSVDPNTGAVTCTVTPLVDGNGNPDIRSNDTSY